jgi:ATP-binding cassette subfamily B protein
MSATAEIAAPETKPDPTLPGAKRSRLGQFADLGWLCREIARVAPRQTRAWIVATLIGGFGTPLGLWLTKSTIDDIQARLDGEPAPWLWIFVAGLIAMTLYDLLLEKVQAYFDAYVRERASEELQARVLAKATRLDLETYEHQGFYDRVSRVLNETEERAGESLWAIVFFGGIVPQVAGYTVALLLIDWRLVPIAIVPLLPVIYVWFAGGGAYWNVLTEQTRDRRLADYYASLLTDRQAAKEIRLFGLHEYAQGRWEELYWQTRDEARRKMARIAVRQRGSTLAGVVCMTVGLIWALSVLPAGLAAGTYIIVIQSFFAIPNRVFNFAESIAVLGTSAGFAHDLRSFLGMPTMEEPPHPIAERANTPAKKRGAVEIEGLCYRYPGTAQATLSRVDLSIARGETVALVGENGAGKTTLIKLILGLYLPDEGHITLDGRPTASLTASERARAMTGVFQHFTRYPLTVAENVTLQGEKGGRNVDVGKALATAGLASLPARLPGGVDTVLAPDLGGVDLSGGQWQRLAIARAGWRDAALLVLDEPTAALDPLAEVAIFRRFAELAAGRTTILVSHRLGMARLADRIVVLEHGCVVESGSHDALLAQNGEYAAMWEMQARWYR